MKKLLLCLPLFSLPCSAQDLGSRQLSIAFNMARSSVLSWSVPRQPVAGFEEFPRPDAATLAKLAKRVPGLNTSAIRTIPFDVLDKTMSDAADKALTYLDIITGAFVQSGASEIYYVPPDSIAKLDAKYMSGTLPFSGVAKDGRPYRMEAILAGGGKLNMLFDRMDQFSVMDGSNEIKLVSAGNVGCQVKGPGSIGITGLQGCGCMGPFCGCTDIKAMTKVSSNEIRVDTDAGPQKAALYPVRRK